MPPECAVLHLRLEEALKRDFVEAARRENTTPSRAMRNLIQGFVRESRRKEAKGQSRIVAVAPDYDETMEDVAAAQDWLTDRTE